MKKVELKLCMGTMCYVMGGAELKDAIESLPENLKEHIDLKYIPCVGICDGQERPPVVEINGKRIAGISKFNLIQIVKEEVGNVV